MFGKMFLIISVTLLLPNMIYAEVKDNQNLNQIMSEIAQHMAKAYPIIVSQQEISDQNIELLHTKMTNILALFTQAKPYIKQKSNTYQISYDLILQDLRNTREALKNANSVNSRKQLRSLGTICASCHTQDTQLRTVFKGVARENFNSDIDFAEFSYMSRDYDNAVKYYDKYLQSDQVKTEFDIIRPIQRLITIYLQVYMSPGIAAEQLAEYQKLKVHTDKTRDHLAGWIDGLKKLKEKHKTNVKKVTFKQLESYVNLHIGNIDQAGAEFFSSAEDEVSRAWLRGMLFHYLNTNPPQDQIPKILYWLSICDRTLGYSFNISFADLYLKECIINHPGHKYAEKCYQEYKEFIDISYSGSGGSFIPPKIEDELQKLRAYLK